MLVHSQQLICTPPHASLAHPGSPAYQSCTACPKFSHHSCSGTTLGGCRSCCRQYMSSQVSGDQQSSSACCPCTCRSAAASRTDPSSHDNSQLCLLFMKSHLLTHQALPASAGSHDPAQLRSARPCAAHAPTSFPSLTSLHAEATEKTLLKYKQGHRVSATDGPPACIFTVCILVMAWYRALTSRSLTAAGVFHLPSSAVVLACCVMPASHCLVAP